MHRLIIVSNRLPISVTKQNNESKWSFKLSSGGLVSALGGLQKTTKFLWIGWPGLEVEESDKQLFTDTLLQQYSAFPVFIDEQTSDLHYNGFSNSTIWPLFHYLPGEINFNDEQWLGYSKANEMFADSIADMVQDGDFIWVHDYHLMLLPQMLRQKCKKDVKIGFFLHIPFPASDIYRVLPYRKEIIEGLLEADLVGFHTYDYARHFIASCTRILGLNASPTSIEYQGRDVKVGAYPVGIEPEKFVECLKNPETIEKAEELRTKFKGLKIIVGVERLDYIKGLTQKLLAFKSFLDDHPEQRGKVVLLQVAIPSRTDVEEYKHLQNQVFELIGRINGKFSTLNYSPVQFIYNSVSFTELVSLYSVADVCLITSTRDGMNLVAYEYIASQKYNHGVLILSEFAGAAQSLNGVILVNPWSLKDIKNALLSAVTMDISERQMMYTYLQSYVERFTSQRWGHSFVSDLISSSNENIPKAIINLNESNIDAIANEKILLLVDSDEHSCNKSADFVEYFKDKLTAKISTCVFTDSKDNLDSLYTDRDHSFISCYGAYFKEEHSDAWQNSSQVLQQLQIPDSIVSIFKYYTDRCTNSEVVIEQHFALFSFKKVEPSLANWMSCELQLNLEKLIGHQPLKVTRDGLNIIITAASFDFEHQISLCIDQLMKMQTSETIVLCTKNPMVNRAVVNLKSARIFQL